MTIKKLVGRGIWTNRRHIRAVCINYELVEIKKPEEYYCSWLKYYNNWDCNVWDLPTLAQVRKNTKIPIEDLEIMRWDEKSKILYLKGKNERS